MRPCFCGANPKCNFVFAPRAVGEGNEVDLVIPHGEMNVAVEVKAGRTIGTDFFKGLERFADLFPEEMVERMLVYAGDEARRQRGTRVTPFGDIAATLTNLFG